MNDEKREKSTTVRGTVPTTPDGPTPTDEVLPSGQHADYWVLTEEERAKGFVRPVRTAYVHDTCGTATIIVRAIAETYARDPSYYGATFCCGCRDHFPVGEFKWNDGETVGS